MKRMIVATVGLSALIAAGFYVDWPKAPVTVPAETAVPPAGESAPERTTQPPQTVTQAATTAEEIQPSSPKTSLSTHAARARPAAAEERLVFDQAIASLVSPQTSYEARQAAWKQLKDSGKLGQAIAELEQRVAGDPRSAEAATALGEGYYKEAGATDDVRQKAISAMKADETLETALNLDPSNWEARFTKTVGMSYWPSDLNKGQEVIDQFQMLIQQQETQPSQPQFARTYLDLGEQYQKAGNPDSAAQIWQRGAALFPNNADLQNKLVPPP